MIFSSNGKSQAGVCRRRVLDHELHRVAAAPTVAAQLAGEVDRCAARLGEELSERRSGDAKRDRPQPARFERIGQSTAQMAAPHGLGMDDANAGKHEARLGVARAKGRQPDDVVDQLTLGRGDGERPVNRQFRNQVLAAEPIAEPLGQKRLQGIELLHRDRETRRHRMAAAVDQQPRLARRNHRRTEWQPGDRAARAPANAVRQRDDTGRSLIALLEPRRDDPDHPRVPILGRGKDEDR